MRVCPECGTRTEAERCPNDGRLTVEADKLKVKRADPFIGRIIAGKYKVDLRLGRGGYGAVYRAAHVETGGHVALKLVRADLIDDEQVIRRFYIEAQNTHRLHHPNTVRVSDFGRTDDGALYLVMEYVQGRSLVQVMKEEGGLTASRAVRIAEQVLKSLGEAHAHNLVHRDIKPQNVMLIDQFGEPDFVKLLDFGISRSLDNTGASTQGVVGTPRYMAPEQWLSLPVDARTDIYSLGCMIYEMLAGRMPWDINADARGPEAALSFMTAHVKLEPEPLGQLVGPSCPTQLSDLVMRMLSKRPHERPASAEAVLGELKAIQREHDLYFSRPIATGVQAATTEPQRHLEGDEETLSHSPSDTETMDKPRLDQLGMSATLDPLSGESSRLREVYRDESGELVARPRRWSWPWVAALVAVAAAVVAVLAVGDGRPGDAPPSAAAPTAERSPSEPGEPAEPAPPAEGEGEREPAQPAPETAEDGPADQVEEERPAKPAPAAIKLASGEQVVAVFDAAGEPLGQTPLTLESPPLKTGSRITLSASEHRSKALELVFPAPGAERTVDVALEALPQLTFQTRPAGATVTIAELDLKVEGRSPFSWRMTEQAFDRLEADGILTFEFKLAGRLPGRAKLVKRDIRDGTATVKARLSRPQKKNVVDIPPLPE